MDTVALQAAAQVNCCLTIWQQFCFYVPAFTFFFFILHRLIAPIVFYQVAVHRQIAFHSNRLIII